MRLFLNGFKRFYISSLLIDLLGSSINSNSLKSLIFFILTRRISPSTITESLSLNYPSSKIAYPILKVSFLQTSLNFVF